MYSLLSKSYSLDLPIDILLPGGGGGGYSDVVWTGVRG